MKKITFTLFAIIVSLASFASGHIVTISSTNITCSGLCDGSATATVSGGVGPFSYSWSPFGGTLAAATGLCAGVYTVTVTDNSDLSTATATVAINVPAPIGFSSITPMVVCYGNCINYNPIVSGGTPPYNYNWTASGLIGISPSIIVCPLVTTAYTLTVTDMNGCIGSITSIATVDGPITSTISSINASNCGSPDGSASVAPTGGVSPYSYDWFPGTPTGDGTANISGLMAGMYSVLITDSYSCNILDSTRVFNATTIDANFTMVPDSANAYRFYGFNSSTGTAASYAWSFGDGGTSSLENPFHTYSTIGVYNVCLIASNFLCGADTLCQNITVTGALSSCLSLFNIADDTISPNPNSRYVYNLSYGATLTYLWDFGDGTTSTLATPSHVYTSAGPYLLCLTVNNGSGCTQTYCDSVISADSINRSSGVIKLVVLDVPSSGITTGIAQENAESTVAVSPNPFSDNTTFSIQSNILNETYSFELTDVLGKKVKSINGITEKEFQLSRTSLPNGIYFYKIMSAEKIIGIGKVVLK
jgi:PKD repeat protein